MTQAENQLLTVLEKRLRFETILTELSARFVKLDPNEVDQEIECTLQQVFGFFRADRCGLLEALAAPYRMQVTHAAYGPDVEGFSPEIYLANSFPWHYQRLFVDKQPVSIERLKDLPAEAEEDRQTAVAMGIRSMLSIPVSYDNRISHFLMFQTLCHEHHWPEEYVSRLRLLVEIFVSALTRKKAYEALLEREASLSLAAESADAGLWSLDINTKFACAIEKIQAIFSFPESISFDRWLDEVCHPNDRERIRKLVDQAIHSRKDFSSEYRIILPDGNER
jgi:GAF domain-containing protein